MEIGIDVVFDEVEQSAELRKTDLLGQWLISIGNVVQKFQNMIRIQIVKIFITMFLAKFLSDVFICPDGVVSGIVFVVIQPEFGHAQSRSWSF